MAETDDVSARLAAALERIGEASRVLLRSAAASEGLSPTQAQVLLRLRQTRGDGGQHGVVALAAWLDVSAPTVSDAVAALERKDVVVRDAAHGDARRTVVRLTRRGAAVARRLQEWDAPLRNALAAAERSVSAGASLATMLEVTLQAIVELQRAGVVTVARTCRGCRFFDPDGRARSSYWCGLLDAPLEPATLRLDCPDFEAAASG